MFRSPRRRAAAHLTRAAKASGVCIVLVGHVTKEGALAGPRVLEHMVDTVLYFEGDTHSSFRLVRAIKNRFGAVNEIGVFAMTEKGLKEVTNPSAIFLNRANEPAAGSAVVAVWEVILIAMAAMNIILMKNGSITTQKVLLPSLWPLLNLKGSDLTVSQGIM